MNAAFFASLICLAAPADSSVAASQPTLAPTTAVAEEEVSDDDANDHGDHHGNDHADRDHAEHREVDDDHDFGFHHSHHHRWHGEEPSADHRPSRKAKRRHKEWDDLVRGMGVTFLAGGDLRARDDIGRLGRLLGPAADPSRFGTAFSIQGYMALTKYARIGLDFSYAGFSASGRGPDRGNIEVRQTVDYRFWAGGLMGELVLPVTKRVELSFGSALGAARLEIQGRSTRMTDYSQLGTDLRAIAKSETFALEAPAFFAKPALGVKLKFSQHIAMDMRAGVQVFYVFRNTLSVFGDFPLNNSPAMTEVLPFLQLGLTFGSWAR